MRYIHSAKVIGRGAFPIDMLRYDRCTPATEEDSTKMAYGYWRTVTVTATSERLPYRHFTAARWKSFGWEIIEEEGNKMS